MFVNNEDNNFGGVCMLRFKWKKDNENKDNMVNIIKSAYIEWKEREMLLEEVTESDLIDYAIYEIEASRIKYIYLLKKYKNHLKGKDTGSQIDEKAVVTNS